MKKIAILTDKNSWICKYIPEIIKSITYIGYSIKIYYNIKNIPLYIKFVFVLNYPKIINYIKKHKFLVIHSSNLPIGKGWSPLFWQILEGKSLIITTLFEANENLDSGKIYCKQSIFLNGTELNKELRYKQFLCIQLLIIDFLNINQYYKPINQFGKESFYKKRNPKDSELNINKSIKEQFNLLRIVNNEKFPAFFYFKNQKYILKIDKGG